MKNKSLFLLLATSALVLGGCGGNNPDPSSTTPSTPSTTSETTSENTSETTSETTSEETSNTSEGEVIEHQTPFVSTIENPSALRNFDERFDEIADDFTSEQINGTTTGTVTSESKLRVLVDSKDVYEPTTPDRAIYKMGTGFYDLPTYDAIGFRIRMVGNGALKLSNLVLALRGGDDYKVYEIKLSEALDQDGDALPALNGEYQDFIISPQQSIEDANAVYENKDGTPSEVKVLDTIVGFHLYALSEECSAVLEINEVFLVKGGDRTPIDIFDREAINKADDTCWWRDSYGFIVQKGVTLVNGQSYTAPKPVGTYSSLVLNILGDTSGTALKVGNGVYEWARLKDSENAAVSSAVNGAFYHLVINSTNSEFGALTEGFSVTSTTEVTISEVFYTNMEVPAPVVNYPTFDMNSLFIYDNFNREQSGFNGDYDAAIVDQKTINAGLTYQLSYNNGNMVRVNGSALEFDASELGATDYINYKALNLNNPSKDRDYMIIALKATDGATLDNFRFNIGNGVTYINQMYSGEGLKVASLGQADYPYIKDGYTWLVIDLKVSNMVIGNEPFIDYYYSGTGKLLVDFVAFADAPKDEYKDTLYVEKTYADQAGYDYAGYVYSPATSRYIKLVAETEGTIDSIRFGVDGVGDFWFHDGKLKDENGNVIPATSSAGTYIIDLVASGMKEEGKEVGIHVHGDGSNGAISIKVYSLDLKEKTMDTLYVEKTYADQAGYDYAGYVYSPATSRYIKLVAETQYTIANIRFTVDGLGEFWFKDGKIVDDKGNTISKDAPAGTYIIDLVASGMKEEGHEGGIHVHGDGLNGAISIKVYSVDLIPEVQEVASIINKDFNLAGYNYGGQINNYGAKTIVLNIKSEDAGVNLRSLRFASEAGEFWFKDGKLLGLDGEPISDETAVTSEGIRLVIDLEKTGLTDKVIHFHLGGFEGSIGNVSVSVSLEYDVNTIGFILAAMSN